MKETIIYQCGYFRIIAFGPFYWLEQRGTNNYNAWNNVAGERANILGLYRLVKKMEAIRDKIWYKRYIEAGLI